MVALPTLPQLVSLVLVLLVESVFIHLAASLALGGAKFSRAFLTAVVGSLLAFIALVLLGGANGGISIWGVILALILWVAACSSIYRTSWLRAALIGVVAWLLWWGTLLLVQAVAKGLGG